MDDLTAHPASDRDLLRAFSRGDANALGELARRHWSMVYGVCRRDLGDAHLAEDAAQAAFIVLAKKGANLPSKVIIAGWLFKVARYAAADLRKMEHRRQLYERKAASMKTQVQVQNVLNSEPDESAIAMLNSAIAALAKKDRDVLLLRFFENRSIGEIAAALGVAQDAAGKRVSRAVERLRSIFASHGIFCTADALETRLQQQETILIPQPLLAALLANSATHLTTAGASSAIAHQVIKRMLAAKIKLVVLSAALAGAVAVPVVPLIYHEFAAPKTIASTVPRLTAPVLMESPLPPLPFPVGVGSSWVQAGAISGWMDPQQGFYFGGIGVTGRPGDVPAFWVQEFMLAKISDLPEPDQHFGLELAYANITDSILKRLAQFTQLQMLDLKSTSISDTGLKELADLTQLQWLDISYTQVTDAGLNVLAGFGRLRVLNLGYTQVTDLGLIELAGLTQLHELDLNNTQVTGASLNKLADLTQLRTLDLASAPVTDAGLYELASLKYLQSLDISNTHVTDAGMNELTALTQLQSLNLDNTTVTDAGLKQLADLTQLQSLDLGGAHITDAGLKELAGLSQLQSLDLSGAHVTDTGLTQLADLTQLQSLNLGYTQVTNIGLKDLAGLKNLWSLDLTAAHVSDAGLKQLASLTSLHSLNLAGTQVTGTGLNKLARLAALHSLNLAGTPMTSTGLKKLAVLRHVMILNLDNTPVTDADLKNFVGLKQLRELDLKGTHVTDAGVTELKKKMPFVDIIH